jgi:ankyrin repeat protein
MNGLDAELIRTFVSYGVNINSANKEGKTALLLAAEENESETVAALLESGADPNIRSRDGRTAADIADGESVRAALFNYGAIPNK